MNEQEAHELVFEALTKALGQNTGEIKLAENKLHEWESLRGFNSILLNIFNNNSIDTNVRLLALLYCKNGINKYWRPSAPNSLSSEEKSYIRSGLLHSIPDPIHQISVQKAVLLSKIARVDWPDNCPGLVETLVTKMEGPGKCDTALALHYTVKALCSKSLPRSVAHYQTFSEQLLPLILNYWYSSSSATIQQFDSSLEDEANKHLEYAYLLLKMIEKMLVVIGNPNMKGTADNFVKFIIPHIKKMLDIRLSTGHRGLLEKYCTRLMRVLSKTYSKMGSGFDPHIRPTVSLIGWLAFTQDGCERTYPLLLGHAFKFLSDLIPLAPTIASQMGYFSRINKPSRISDEVKSMFDNECTSRMAYMLVMKYFSLKKDEMELWQSDPETFVDQWSEKWEGNPRNCAIDLFTKLLEMNTNDHLLVLMKQMMVQHPIPSDPSDMQVVICCDAVYTAVQIILESCFLQKNMFPNLLETALRDLEKTWDKSGPGVIILKRRAAFLTRASNYFPAPDDIYRILLRLLDKREDLVVRLTATDTLKQLVIDLTFNQKNLEPYLDSIVIALIDLLQSLSQVETKMVVLEVIIAIVDQLGTLISKQLSSFEQILSNLYAEAKNTPMLLANLVRLLEALVRSCISEMLAKPVWLDMCFGAIAAGTDMSSDSRVYLLDESLELWHSLLMSLSVTPDELTNRLLSLASNLHNILENNTEYMKRWIQIVIAYTCLLPEQFITSFGENIVRTTASQFHELNETGIEQILKVYEMFIRVSPSLGFSVLRPVLPQILRSTINEEITENVMVFCIMSRLLLVSSDSFSEIFKGACADTDAVDSMVDKMVSLWCESPSPCETTKDRKKLRAMGLCALLTLNLSVLYNKFCGILLAVGLALKDITDWDVDVGQLVDKLVLSEELVEWFSDESDCEYTQCNAHEDRRRRLVFSDPVHTVSLIDYLNSQLNTLKNMVGESNWKGLIDTVDVETLAEIKKYISI